MLTILFSVTVKPGHEAEFGSIAERMTKTTNAEDEGCISYTFYRQTDSPLKVILFEQWSDQESLSAHVARLRDMLGPPDEDEALPATHIRRRLPKAFMDLFEDASVTRYEPVVDAGAVR